MKRIQIDSLSLALMFLVLAKAAFAGEIRSWPYEPLSFDLGSSYVFETTSDVYSAEKGGIAYNPNLTAEAVSLLEDRNIDNFGECLEGVSLEYKGEHSCESYLEFRKNGRKNVVLFSNQFGSLAHSTFDSIILFPVIFARTQRDNACGDANIKLHEFWEFANSHKLWCD